MNAPLTNIYAERATVPTPANVQYLVVANRPHRSRTKMALSNWARLSPPRRNLQLPATGWLPAGVQGAGIVSRFVTQYGVTTSS